MSYGTRRIEFGEITVSFKGLASRNWPMMVAYAVALGVVDLIAERFLPESVKTLVTGVIGLGTGFAMNVLMMQRERLIDSGIGKPSFWSYFGTALVAGLGIVVGFLFFIVPGFYLLGRWSIASQFVIGKGLTATEALGASRDATLDSVWIIALFYFVALVVGLVGVTAIGGIAAVGAGSVGLIATFAVQVATEGFQVLGFALNISLYGLLVPQSDALKDVFS